jgi:hypothetical protein
MNKKLIKINYNKIHYKFKFILTKNVKSYDNYEDKGDVSL